MKPNATSLPLQEALQQLVKDAAQGVDPAQLKQAVIGLDDAARHIRQRIAWLRRFGELVALCGLPPEKNVPVVLPVSASAVHGLLTTFEMGLPGEGALDDTPATLCYLLFKSASLRGKSDQMPWLEVIFERWAKNLKMKTGDMAVAAVLHADAPAAPESILLAWLERWGFKGCEFIVLEALARTRPYLEFNQSERLETLRREMPERTRLPERDLPFHPVRIRTDVAAETLRGEIVADLAARRDLPIYLLRQHDTSERNVHFALSPQMTHDTLTRDVARHLADALKAQSVVAVSLRNQVGSVLQEQQVWLAVTPIRAAENGLTGARIWISLEVRSLGDGNPEALWSIYLGVDPAGMGLKSFLDLAGTIRSDGERILATLARDAHEVIRDFLAEHAQQLRRAPLIRSQEDEKRKPV